MTHSLAAGGDERVEIGVVGTAMTGRGKEMDRLALR